MLGQTPPEFERAVHYSDLTEADVAALAEFHHSGQMALFEEISRRAAEMKRQNPRGNHRFRAGAYFHQSGEDAP